MFSSLLPCESARVISKRAFAFIPLIISLATGHARAADAFSIADAARLRQVDAAAVAPNGASVAYVLRVPRVPGREKDGPAWAELHVVDVAGGASRPFVSGAVNVSAIRWRPDGGAISFLAKMGDDKHKRLYSIALDGGQARPLVTAGNDVSDYAWSPDGKQIAYLAADAEPADKEKRRKQGFKAEIYEEELHEAHVWIADATGAGQPRKLDLPGSAARVEWSPAGKQLIVKSSRTPLIDDAMMFSRLVVVDVESGKATGAIETEGKLGDFQISADGKNVAFIGAEDKHDPAAGRLMVGPLTGGKPRDLLPKYAGHVVAIAWQGSDNIMYVGHEGVEATFGKVAVDGSLRKTILPAGGPIFTALTLAADGQSGALVGDAAQHPAELFAMKHGDSAPRRLTNSNPWLASRAPIQQEVVRYKARDGLELEGIVFYPNGFQQGQHYPLVLVVHGGPEAHVSDGWSYTQARVLAARGFVVFEPNYRGSTGRGVDFSKLDQHDYAGKEFDDLVDAVDHLVEKGVADPKHVGVTGGSYGGYATAWCATKLSERFAAGVMIVGLSDNISSWGTTDIPQEMYLVHARAWPWEDWDFFRERSPVFHAQNSQTPLLILGGAADTRVHPSQSLEMYRYLKLANKAPVRLVWYPGEGHGNQNAAARHDALIRTVEWLEHYLKGPGGEPPAYDVDYKLDDFASDPIAAPAD